MDPLKLGDTPDGVWLMEVMNDCLRDLPNNRTGVDMNLLVNKCRAEPKLAQFAMQMLAEEMKRMLGGRSVKDPPEEAVVSRLVLGSLFQGYCVARNIDAGLPIGEFPAELKHIVQRYPLIVECSNVLSEDNV